MLKSNGDKWKADQNKKGRERGGGGCFTCYCLFFVPSKITERLEHARILLVYVQPPPPLRKRPGKGSYLTGSTPATKIRNPEVWKSSHCIVVLCQRSPLKLWSSIAFAFVSSAVTLTVLFLFVGTVNWAGIIVYWILKWGLWFKLKKPSSTSLWCYFFYVAQGESCFQVWPHSNKRTSELLPYTLSRTSPTAGAFGISTYDTTEKLGLADAKK